MPLLAKTTMTKEPRFATVGVSATVLLLFEIAACSTPFEDCNDSRTCTAPGETGNGGDAGGLRADGGARSGGAGAGAAGGTGNSAGGGVGGISGSGTVVDASSHDATPDVPPGQCSFVDGGILSDPDHCGSCSRICSTTGATDRTCVSGACVPICDSSHRDCNGATPRTGDTDGGALDGGSFIDASGGEAGALIDHDDGCEIDITSDADHCGACDAPCSKDGTTSNTCSSGKCKPTCDVDHANLDGDDHNGCEVALQTDPANCGAVGYACSTAGAGTPKCAGGKCAPVCTATHGDCSTPTRPALDDGCETDLTQPTDCGRCGHDCLGGACATLKCQELVIADQLPDPSGFVVDDKYVHWVDTPTGNGRMVQRSLRGTSQLVRSSVEQAPGQIVEGNGNVYWTVKGYGSSPAPGIRFANPDSGAAQDFAPQNRYPTMIGSPATLSIAAGGNYLYWGDDSNYQVWQIYRTGSQYPTPTTPSVGGRIYELLADASYVYYVTVDGVSIAPTGQGGPQLLHPAPSGGFAMDGSFVYFVGNDGGGYPSVMKVSRVNTGTPEVVMHVQASATALAVDASYFYFWNPTGLYRIGKATGAKAELLGSANNVGKIMIHDEPLGTAVYWLNRGQYPTQNGSIMKLAL